MNLIQHFASFAFRSSVLFLNAHYTIQTTLLIQFRSITHIKSIFFFARTRKNCSYFCCVVLYFAIVFSSNIFHLIQFSCDPFLLSVGRIDCVAITLSCENYFFSFIFYYFFIKERK